MRKVLYLGVAWLLEIVSVSHRAVGEKRVSSSASLQMVIASPILSSRKKPLHLSGRNPR